MDINCKRCGDTSYRDYPHTIFVGAAIAPISSQNVPSRGAMYVIQFYQMVVMLLVQIADVRRNVTIVQKYISQLMDATKHALTVKNRFQTVIRVRRDFIAGA